ncbi:MAG: ArsR family transcriptional regulator, partial [Clostridia bacterium]|nr:ArsR family transcriptional regulator [Clostridia bacterium]
MFGEREADPMEDGRIPAGEEPETLPDDEVLYDLAELFKVFGDTTRVKILYVLFESELCVNDIALRLTMTPSA